MGSPEVKVTVFCSSLSHPGDPEYTQGLMLGKLLGEAGHTVLTGGYIGSMEAVSRGAAEAGGHVIGVTCQEIEDWRPSRANPWVLEEQKYPTLRDRLFALLDGCDAAIALPGGIGTLAEISMLWSHLQTAVLSPRKLIVIGDGWKTVLETFWKTFDGQIAPKYRSLVTFVPDVEQAVRFLAE